MKFVVSFALLFILSNALAGSPDSKRAKVIDFDDEVVEGLNKKPWDSLSEISEQDRRRKKSHLYLKRVGFRPEIAQNLKTLPDCQ